MGVGQDLAGRSVRCPHCKQVVKAPAAAPAPASVSPVAPTPQAKKPVAAPAPPPPPAPAKAPAAEREYDFPQFTPPKEAHDSILGDPEESEDEVFTSSHMGNRLPAPRLPLYDAPPPPPAENDATLVARGSTAPRSPARPAPPPEPDPTENPWAGHDTTAEVPPEFGPADDEPEAETEPAAKPAARPRPPEPAPAGRGLLGKLLFVAVLGWAVAATGAAVYGLFFRTPKNDLGHPLENLPDNFGEYDASKRQKSSSLRWKLDGALPESLKVALGGKLQLGQLDVEPVKVERRKLTVYQKIVGKADYNENPPDARTLPSYVLTLKLTNTSADVVFHPTDPAFNRAPPSDPKEPKPGTGLAIPGRDTFWGGPFKWPHPKDRGIEDEYVKGQEGDKEPLLPGKSREAIVVTQADNRIHTAMQNASDTVVWRVQLRHGLYAVGDKEVPVTGVVGVTFRPNQVEEVVD